MRRRLKYISLVSFPLGIVCLASSCSSKPDDHPGQPDSNVLLTVGDSSLTRDYVLGRMPAGVSGEDSLRLFDAVVRNWVIDMLLVDVASANLPDYSRIERMVNAYRRSLILGEYRRLLAENNTRQISEDSVKAYYQRNAERLRLSHPILKGIYIKVPDNAERIDDLRRWIFSGEPQDIDRLEKYGLKWAMQYDYFVDRWIDWRTVASEIPYRFSDPDRFLSENSNFETSYDGSAYFLHVSDYIRSGEKMPYEYAATVIPDILLTDGRQHYDTELINYIYSKALKSGKLKEAGYTLSQSGGDGSHGHSTKK